MARIKKSRVATNEGKGEKKGMKKSIAIKKTKTQTNVKKRSSKTSTKQTSEPNESLNGSISESLATHSKTPSVVTTETSVAKRRSRGNKSSTESQFFSQREKKAFYDCLVENGFHVINNNTVLKQLFPNRSENEIKQMKDSYIRRAQELNRKSDETVNSEPNSNKQPIEKWFDLIHQLVPNPSKKDDISAILAEIFSDSDVKPLALLSETESSKVLSPDYNQIYECIRSSLNGEYAPQLSPMDAFVVLNLIEDLKRLLKSDSLETETEFLNSGSWWSQKEPKTSDDLVQQICSQRQQQNALESTQSSPNTTESKNKKSTQNLRSSDRLNEMSTNESVGIEGQSSTDAMNSNRDMNFEILQNYPKLRKIIECFNPLKVPIDLIQSQYNRWQQN